MTKVSTSKILCSIGIVSVPLFLAGCSFGTSQQRANCNGQACDCEMTYYGLDAGIFLDGAPVEHASLRVTIPKVEPDTDNSTGCCAAMFGVCPFNYSPRENRTDAGNVQSFCDLCKSSPNTDVSKAAGTCTGPTGLLSESKPVVHTTDIRLRDNPPAGSDQFHDCSIDFGIAEANVTLPNQLKASGATSSFNLKWTDSIASGKKACCAALRPVIQSLFVMGSTPAASDKKQFCDACSSAYNTGVALAAYRMCTSATRSEKSVQPSSSADENNVVV